MAKAQEPGASLFQVCFLTVDGKPLTIVGPPDAIEALEERLRDAGDVELHRFERPPPSDAP
jgi:hypothetical protein